MRDCEILQAIADLPERPLKGVQYRLSDEAVELMRVLHEEHGVGYRRLSRLFKIGKTQVRRICLYTQR